MRMCEFVLFGGSPLSQAGFASGPRFGTPPAVCLQAMQRQVEVQRRIKQKVGSKEFEDTIQEWRVFWRAVWRFGALMADIGWAKKNKTPLCLLAWPKHTHTHKLVGTSALEGWSWKSNSRVSGAGHADLTCKRLTGEDTRGA